MEAVVISTFTPVVLLLVFFAVWLLLLLAFLVLFVWFIGVVM
jgi:hypothetical protein